MCYNGVNNGPSPADVGGKRRVPEEEWPMEAKRGGQDRRQSGGLWSGAERRSEAERRDSSERRTKPDGRTREWIELDRRLGVDDRCGDDRRQGERRLPA